MALNVYNSSVFLDKLITNKNYDVLNFPNTFDELSKIHFFIYIVKNNFLQTLTSISKNMNKNSIQEKIVDKGVIRGKIDWTTTLQERMKVGGIDNSIFVTKPTKNEFNTLPNQVYKFILLKLLIIYEDVEKLLGPDSNFINKQAASFLIDRLKIILKYPKLRDINTLKSVDKKMVNYLKKNRKKEYRHLAKIIELYLDIFILKKKETLFEVLKNQLLLPASDDKIYELFVLFKVINAFQINLFEISKMNLLRRNQNNILSFQKNTDFINVYYQYVPQQLSSSNLYKTILNEYKVANPKTRQPDIIIEFIEDGTTYYKLIEVKCSNSRTYIGEGVHDVLSYYSDFNEHLSNENPAIMLVVWAGITNKTSFPDYLPICLTDNIGLNDSLQEFIKKPAR